MKKFDLTKIDFNQFYVTRNGTKVKLIANTSDFHQDSPYPIVGYLMEKDGWSYIPTIWTINGKFATDIDNELDIIGVWEEKQPEVTITIPAPIKEAQDGQEVWYFGFNPTEYLLNPKCDHIYSMKFKSNIYFRQYLLETGQLFATKEDVQEFLSALKGARR